MNINEYKIIKGSLNEVEYYVNELISQGWQPFGDLNVIHVVEGCYTKYYQAMVR